MKDTRRGFLSSSAALAAWLGMGGRAFGAPRPKFGFDVTKCKVNPRFVGHPLFSGEPVCGVNLGFLSKRGYFAREDVKRMPREMAESGVNWCMLNTHFCQETFASRKLFFDPVYSAGEIELTEIVKRLKGEGLHVCLKPCLTTLDSSWMGAVRFPHDDHQIQGVHTSAKYWPEWFGSLREVLKPYGEFCERNGVEAALLGAEYTGTIDETEEWLKTFEEVRRIYSGPLSYEFTRNPEPDGDDSVYREWAAKIPFVDTVDFLSLSWYPRGRPHKGSEGIPKCPETTLREMVDYMRPARAKFDKTIAEYGPKPVLFTEIGQRSARGCVSSPWDAWTETARDEREQADYMEAVFETFADKPQWAGMFWWKWDETQKRDHFDPDPRKDRGFRIYGKSACDVFRKWSGRS